MLTLFAQAYTVFLFRYIIRTGNMFGGNTFSSSHLWYCKKKNALIFENRFSTYSLLIKKKIGLQNVTSHCSQCDIRLSSCILTCLSGKFSETANWPNGSCKLQRHNRIDTTTNNNKVKRFFGGNEKIKSLLSFTIGR